VHTSRGNCLGWDYLPPVLPGGYNAATASTSVLHIMPCSSTAMTLQQHSHGPQIQDLLVGKQRYGRVPSCMHM
jgi:hypothetical protein